MGTWAIVLGVAWVAGSCALAALGVEPVATSCYLFAWSGLLFTLDRLIARAEGRSLIRRLGWVGVGALGFWSAANWFLYEALNLRLRNWYYVLVADDDLQCLVGTFAAFATVFPAVLWIEHWLAARGLAASRRGPCLRSAAGGLWALQALGVAFLALSLADPGHFYPMVWGFATLLLAPLNYRLGIDGLLRQWERGDWGPMVRLLLAGALAGGCWELLNFWARAKWIYTVPFFDELKLFEMPLLGFLGFPPFALECAELYRLLVWYRLAPGFGGYAQQGPARGAGARLAVAAPVLAFSLVAYAGVDRLTVTSRTPPVAAVAALTESQRQVLLDNGARYLTDLEGWGSHGRWARVEAALGLEEAAHVRGVVALYLHRGIGVDFGNRLAAAGFRSPDDLRGLSVDDLYRRLASLRVAGPMPSRAQVKVWLGRLPPAAQSGS